MNFRLVASPNNWSRESKQRPGLDQISDRRLAYQEFFQQLLDELREKDRFTNAKAGQPQNWFMFTSGAGRFQYGMSFAATGELRSELYIDFDKRSKNELAFDALYAEKDVIEKEFGEPPRWERLDNRRACRVACYTVGSIEDPVESHEQYRNWAIERLLRFKRVFGPRLPALVKRVQEL